MNVRIAFLAITLQTLSMSAYAQSLDARGDPGTIQAPPVCQGRAPAGAVFKSETRQLQLDNPDPQKAKTQTGSLESFDPGRTVVAFGGVNLRLTKEGSSTKLVLNVAEARPWHTLHVDFWVYLLRGQKTMYEKYVYHWGCDKENLGPVSKEFTLPESVFGADTAKYEVRGWYY